MGNLRGLLGALRLVRWSVGALGVALGVSLVLGGVGSAASTLAFPAPAGTQWSVVAGYNTATHIAGDPYAIDVVRDDAETSGTPVLAPADGTLSISANCLTIRDASRVAILLCHVLAAPGLRAGQRVTQGQLIGAVAPPGQAGNNGLAHIHIAAHYAEGGRGFGTTIPLVAAYAVEGVALPATAEANAYYGLTFRSSNVQGASTTTSSAPAVVQPPASIAPTDEAGRLAGFTAGTRSLAVVTGAATTEELVVAATGSSGRPCTLSSVVGGGWVTYVRGAPEAVNARWRAVYPAAVPAMTPLFTACG